MAVVFSVSWSDDGYEKQRNKNDKDRYKLSVHGMFHCEYR